MQNQCPRQWFLDFHAPTSSISLIWEPVRNAVSWVPLQTDWVWLCSVCLKGHPRNPDVAKFEGPLSSEPEVSSSSRKHLRFIFNFKKIYLFMAVLGLHCCVRAFSSCCMQGFLSSCGAWASHCSGFSCCGAHTLGTWAKDLRCRLSCPVVRNLPRPWIKPMSTALAGTFFTAGPPGKSAPEI